MHNLIRNISLTFMLCLFLVQSAWSQDIIIKKTGDEIKCKVQEVGTELIRYSVFPPADSLSKELLSIKKEEVFMIRYENGTKDVFSTTQEDDYAKTVTTQPQTYPLVQASDKIEIDKGKFYYHNRRIGGRRLYALLRNEKNQEINQLVTNAIVCSVFSPVLKFATIPFGVVGFSLLMVNSIDNNALDPNDKLTAGVGIGALVLGQAGGYTLDFFKKKQIKEAVVIYNQTHP